MNDEYSPVGVLIFIFGDGSIQSSTGTLIGPNLVLTSTHSLQSAQDKWCIKFIYLPACTETSQFSKWPVQTLRTRAFRSTASLNEFRNMNIGS